MQWFAAAHLLREADLSGWEEVTRHDVQEWIMWLLASYRAAYVSNQFPPCSSSSGSPPRTRSPTRWPG